MRKLIVNCFYALAITSYLLPIAFAEETCSSDSQCSDNIYYTDSTTGECIHKSGGYCDTTSPFVDARGCVFAYIPVDVSLCAEPIPKPSSTPAPTPVGSTVPTSPAPIEQDVYSLNSNILPKEVRGAEAKESVGDDIISKIKQFLSQILNQAKFFNQSNSFAKSQTPNELHQNSNIQQNLEGALGKSSGVFGVELPKEIQTDKTIESWQRFKQSVYPKELLQ